MSARGLDTTGRPLDPPAEGVGPRARPDRAARGDRGSPSFTDDWTGTVIRPANGASPGSAVASIDFAAAVASGHVDLGAVVRDSRVHEVLEELDRDLVGLGPVKRRIREIAALLVIDRVRREMGLSARRPTLHMSFTGSPGTGKTTVALRMASILHRLGYIERGHLVSVTRDDLVGQYVGHTAPKTKDAVKRALGGILFIDEAYYLHRPENERDYGQEAVEVLLQVLESERENLVVILAGYADRMEAFFQANPGMGSRVAHHIAFPDYDANELLAIARLMVREQGYELGEGAERALTDYIGRRLERPRFAHGRSVRNAVDRARMRQAMRLFDAGDTVARSDLVTLAADDILRSSVFTDAGDRARTDAVPGIVGPRTTDDRVASR